MPIQIVDGRFVLEPDAPRTGGTSHVYRARDHEGSERVVAIKLYDGSALTDELRCESFMREREALQTLAHPNIVQLIAAGFDEERGQHYVALEWLNHSLLDGLTAHEPDPHGRTDWGNFSEEVLEPLLQALALAHSRRVLHRDIKPQNVMVDASGVPKLTDFGLAKLLDSVRFGVTVAQFQTRPYTPPEQGHAELDARSDLYSLGVTALRCLVPNDFDLREDNLAEALQACELPAGARELLHEMTSRDPATRPRTAGLALNSLRRVRAETHVVPTGPRPRVHLRITAQLVRQAQGTLQSSDESGVRTALRRDLEGELSIARSPKGGISQPRTNWGQESKVKLDLIGEEFLYIANFDANGSGTLVVTGLRELPPGTLERRREAALLLPHKVVFEPGWERQRADADLLIEKLAELEANNAADEVHRKEARLFDRWGAVLDAKTELELRREDPLGYRGWRKEPGIVTFSLADEVDDQYIGQVRRIPLRGGGAVVGTILDAGGREIDLAVERGNVESLPLDGKLIIDRLASKRAIERQRGALTAVRDGTAARPELAELLLMPERAPALHPADVAEFLQDLDSPKEQAVRTALGSQDFTLVQGPPGTGKTTFIAELIAQLLLDQPTARVLLSSQTNVAVDNAAVKLANVRPGLRVVRVGRLEKVDPQAHELTVPEQMLRWQEDAESRARDYLTEWGAERGLREQAMAAYGARDELAIARTSADKLRLRIENLLEEEEQLFDRLTDPAEPSSASTSTSELVVDEADELAAVQDELGQRRAELQAITETEEVVSARLRELLRLSELPAIDDLDRLLDERHPLLQEHLDQFSALGALQEEWLMRFGQSADFEQALLDTAHVVAGTCVGLASALGRSASFDLAIVDEASMATPTEALVPMAHCSRWVLVGDTNQLPPFVDSALAEPDLLEAHELTRADLQDTIFGRLIAELPSDHTVSLTEQHRMVKPIGDLVSHCFYNDELTSARGDQPAWRCLEKAFANPVVWLCTSRMKKRRERPVGTTFWNALEVQIIREQLSALQFYAEHCDETLKVGVITGYGEQALRLRRDLRPGDAKWTHLIIDVHPVDSFQGQERDLIIYSVTRSNHEGKIGFLRFDERLNVALSRGRDGLVIVGDSEFCAKARHGHSPFRCVIEHIGRSPHCELSELS